MRIAILSDIHGNSIALDAVLGDLERRGGADQHWLLGDLVAMGPDPIGVLERITALPNASFVRGNTDRYLVTGERPPPTIEAAVGDPELIGGRRRGVGHVRLVGRLRDRRRVARLARRTPHGGPHQPA